MSWNHLVKIRGQRCIHTSHGDEKTVEQIIANGSKCLRLQVEAIMTRYFELLHSSVELTADIVQESKLHHWLQYFFQVSTLKIRMPTMLPSSLQTYLKYPSI